MPVSYMDFPAGDFSDLDTLDRSTESSCGREVRWSLDVYLIYQFGSNPFGAGVGGGGSSFVRFHRVWYACVSYLS
jgi:hypothetical protein